MTGNWRRLTHASEFASLAAILIIWQLVTGVYHLFPPYFLPSFSAVIETLWGEVLSKQIFTAIAASLYRFTFSVAFGLVSGVIVGLVMGWYKMAYRVAYLLVYVVYPIPVIALFGLFIVWFGLSDMPIMAVGAISAFYPILLNTIAGVKGVDPILVRAARDLGASETQIARKVVIPATVPLIMTGLKVAVFTAFTVDLTAEMIVSPPGNVGLGWEVAQNAFVFGNIPGTYATLIAIGIVGGIIFHAIGWVDGRLAFDKRRVL